jgi:hypothetical protein
VTLGRLQRLGGTGAAGEANLAPALLGDHAGGLAAQVPDLVGLDRVDDLLGLLGIKAPEQRVGARGDATGVGLRLGALLAPERLDLAEVLGGDVVRADPGVQLRSDAAGCLPGLGGLRAPERLGQEPARSTGPGGGARDRRQRRPLGLQPGAADRLADVLATGDLDGQPLAPAGAALALGLAQQGALELVTLGRDLGLGLLAGQVSGGDLRGEPLGLYLSAPLGAADGGLDGGLLGDGPGAEGDVGGRVEQNVEPEPGDPADRLVLDPGLLEDVGVEVAILELRAAADAPRDALDPLALHERARTARGGVAGPHDLFEHLHRLGLAGGVAHLLVRLEDLARLAEPVLVDQPGVERDVLRVVDPAGRRLDLADVLPGQLARLGLALRALLVGRVLDRLALVDVVLCAVGGGDLAPVVAAHGRRLARPEHLLHLGDTTNRLALGDMLPALRERGSELRLGRLPRARSTALLVGDVLDRLALRDVVGGRGRDSLALAGACAPASSGWHQLAPEASCWLRRRFSYFLLETRPGTSWSRIPFFAIRF